MSELPDQPEGIEDDSNDLPSIQGAAERVDAYLRNFGDGLVDVSPAGAWWTDGEARPLYARDLAVLTKHATGDDDLAAGRRRRTALAIHAVRHCRMDDHPLACRPTVADYTKADAALSAMGLSDTMRQ